MATLRIKFRPSTVAGRPGSIIYRITCRNVTRYVVSGCKIYPEEWDAAQSEAMPVHAARTGTIMLINQKLRNDATRIANIIDSMSDNPALLTADGIVARFREPEAPPMFLDFMKGVIRQLREQDKVRCVETYTSTLNSFTAFRNGCDIPISEIDAMLLAEYETYLKARNVTMNTVSFYNRILRAVYNRAADKELTPQRNPFRHVYTGVGKTVKRAIPLGYIRKIKNEDLALKPSMDFARDMFMFSFYTRGMAFVDMAFLRKKDMRDGAIHYVRRKTGQRMTVHLEPCMREIIGWYAPRTRDTPYLFPVLTAEDPARAYVQYQVALNYYNRLLKKLASLLGLDSGLSSYTSRHSWATAARNHNVPLPVISAGMGHTSERTTQIYLSALETSVIDSANRKILASLNRCVSC